MVSLTASPAGCAARVAFKDIRQEFGVHASNELLCQLATQRAANCQTLSEIASNLFEAGRAKLVGPFHVVDISRSDFSGRKKDFAWGECDIPESMGIPAPARVKFRKFQEESDIADRMLNLLGYKQFFLCNPNDGQKTESGVDVLTKLDNQLIGFQVTQYHFDMGVQAGTKRSSARVEESRKRRAGLPATMWGRLVSIPALSYLVQEKRNKGWSEKEFADVRLLIAASIPQDGGTVSTFLLQECLNTDKMNAQLSSQLEATKFSAAYLYVMMPGSVYRWTKETRWERLF